jgi:hypothetical protein
MMVNLSKISGVIPAKIIPLAAVANTAIPMVDTAFAEDINAAILAGLLQDCSPL